MDILNLPNSSMVFLMSRYWDMEFKTFGKLDDDTEVALLQEEINSEGVGVQLWGKIVRSITDEVMLSGTLYMTTGNFWCYAILKRESEELEFKGYNTSFVRSEGRTARRLTVYDIVTKA